jgi:hypothetical protein
MNRELPICMILPIVHSLLELRQQKVVMKLIDALDVEKHLWNHFVWEKSLLVILHQQLKMKDLTYELKILSSHLTT